MVILRNLSLEGSENPLHISTQYVAFMLSEMTIKPRRYKPCLAATTNPTLLLLDLFLRSFVPFFNVLDFSPGQFLPVLNVPKPSPTDSLLVAILSSITRSPTSVSSASLAFNRPM